MRCYIRGQQALWRHGKPWKMSHGPCGREQETVKAPKVFQNFTAQEKPPALVDVTMALSPGHGENSLNLSRAFDRALHLQGLGRADIEQQQQFRLLAGTRNCRTCNSLSLSNSWLSSFEHAG